ncbi:MULTISPECIES: TetR/AcrR family transcriptional regulator [unclassified Ruminococcus]|uniref:TetR/AcrR family transcriptional regulator n=1 Tax=unclassified Ruminococcus TaxID=2608920 RepID=UPI00210CC257|nr:MULTISPECIES: hypothetical protein [unclassified Ruminococcus]MCQ4022509.1 hypothetical protein [Ruminococcus sp. zg-924]MCQ4115148.1 hypothetical protein [Ruminococcus sp. zg-921]
MPPKPKNTQEEIATAAFKIIKQEGIAALTARRLGKSLDCAASSIFTVLPSMEAVKMAARELALAEFKEYISDYREYTPAFKRIGIMIVSYGIHEPELFKLLFMQEHPSEIGFAESLKDLGDIPEVCRELISWDYEMSPEEAALMFEQLWIHAFGLGSMCAMRVIRLSDEEISKRLSVIFAGLVMLIKSGRIKEVYMDVEKNTDGTYHGRKLNELPFVPTLGE